MEQEGERGVFEEADLEADGDDLAEEAEAGVAGARAEAGEGFSSAAGEFDADGGEGGVELEDAAELDFEEELDGVGGEGPTVEQPASAGGEAGGELREKVFAELVADGVDVV